MTIKLFKIKTLLMMVALPKACYKFQTNFHRPLNKKDT